MAAGEEGSELTERTHAGLYPVAPLGDRQLAGIIDAACLLFAFGGFVALFGSLGGQLTLSKMNAAVYLVALSVVYFQYFALFTVFGATTPGMMFRGLQVMSFSGERPDTKTDAASQRGLYAFGRHRVSSVSCGRFGTRIN